jgi:hypothetical protein
LAFLEKHPALKKAIANQYQAILALAAVGFSVVTMNPLPALVWAGAELMTLPFLVDRLKRRMEIEKKYAAREAHQMSQEEQLKALPGAARSRLGRVQSLCDRIEANYRGLSPAGQGVMAEQTEKFETILGGFLRRLWLIQKYDEMAAASDGAEVAAEIARLSDELADPALPPRVKEALTKNLEIQRELESAMAKNEHNRQALDAELDSLEALLQLLLQKSVAATDAAAFTVEIDDALSQVEADHASMEEMEKMLGALPEREVREPLAPKIRAAAAPPPPPPQPERGRVRR